MSAQNADSSPFQNLLWFYSQYSSNLEEFESCSMCILILFCLFKWKFTFLDFSSLPAHHKMMFHFDVPRTMTEKREVITASCCLIRTSLQLSWSWILCSMRGLIAKGILQWNVATKKSHFQHIVLNMDVFHNLSHWARSHVVIPVFSMLLWWKYCYVSHSLLV